MRLSEEDLITKEIQGKMVKQLDIDKILELEKKTKHDVAAFVDVVQLSVGDAGKYIHYGLTSSDVLDTAFSYRLMKSGDFRLSLSLWGVWPLTAASGC